MDGFALAGREAAGRCRVAYGVHRVLASIADEDERWEAIFTRREPGKG
ncbi:hypothetical protein AB0O57_27860 [Streptomyces sp. NPDC091201]